MNFIRRWSYRLFGVLCFAYLYYSFLIGAAVAHLAGVSDAVGFVLIILVVLSALPVFLAGMGFAEKTAQN